MFIPTVVDDYSRRMNAVTLLTSALLPTRLINIPSAIGFVCSTSCWASVLSIPIFFAASPPTKRSSSLSTRNNP